MPTGDMKVTGALGEIKVLCQGRTLRITQKTVNDEIELHSDTAAGPSGRFFKIGFQDAGGGAPAFLKLTRIKGLPEGTGLTLDENGYPVVNDG